MSCKSLRELCEEHDVNYADFWEASALIQSLRREMWRCGMFDRVTHLRLDECTDDWRGGRLCDEIGDWDGEFPDWEDPATKGALMGLLRDKDPRLAVAPVAGQWQVGFVEEGVWETLFTAETEGTSIREAFKHHYGILCFP